MISLIHHGHGERPFAMPLPTEPVIVTAAEIREALGSHVGYYPSADAVIQRIVDATAAFAREGEMWGASIDQAQHAERGTVGFNQHVCGLLRQLGLTPVVQPA